MSNQPTDNPILQYHDSNGDILAMVVRCRWEFSAPNGLVFLTRENEELQLGWFRHPPGHIIRAHFHRPIARVLAGSPEVLFVRRGKLKATIYGTDCVYDTVLAAGDVLLLLHGGHGFVALEETEAWYVKQGPHFPGDKNFIPPEKEDEA